MNSFLTPSPLTSVYVPSHSLPHTPYVHAIYTSTPPAPYDYDGSPVVLTFEPNSTVEIAGIYINADNVVEFMENFTVTLATPPATNELTVQLGTLYMAQVNIQNIDGRE